MNQNKRAAASELPRPNRQEDGVTHINIFSKGKTLLGQKLIHFVRSPFTHPVYGPFDSMEGYWHYIKSKNRPDKLRYLSGLAAKKFGAVQPRENYIENFQDLILEGNYCKITQNPEIMQLLLESELPFEHYYMHGSEDPDDEAALEAALPVRPRTLEWLAPQFDVLRTMIREGRVPPGLVGKVTPPPTPVHP